METNTHMHTQLQKVSSSVFRPMLAYQYTPVVRFPIYASPKLDGVRAFVRAGTLLSRTMKPIPNLALQARLSAPEFEGLDGELIVGHPAAHDVYRRTVSVVMSRKAPADEVTFFAFDRCNTPNQPYLKRYRNLELLHHQYEMQLSGVDVLAHRLIMNQKELDSYEDNILRLGCEGLILRHPDGLYKYGRSTNNEGWMLKLKRFSDAEATIIEVIEAEANTNEATIDARGYTKRSGHAEGMIGKQIAGAFLVEDSDGRVFKVGMGKASAEERQGFWHNRTQLVGRTIKYKYFAIGEKNLPRHPRFTDFFIES